MATKEKKTIKKIDNHLFKKVSIHPLILIGVYVSLLIVTIGGVYLINQKGKQINNTSITKETSKLVKKDVSQAISENNNFDKSSTENTNKTKNSQEILTQNDNDVNDFGAVGSFNRAYLQSQEFTNLVVEIDFIDSVSPNQNSIGKFISTLTEYVDKPDGVTQSGDNAVRESKNIYSVQDLLDIAKDNRSNYSKNSTVSLYVLYVNGEFEQNPNALGVTLNSSMFVIFKDKIRAASTALVFEAEIERAVLNHELGHLFGLVNINYQSDIDHEDKKYPHHSNNAKSVMYWAVEDISVANLLRGGPPYQFDSADQNDIEKIKNGTF